MPGKNYEVKLNKEKRERLGKVTKTGTASAKGILHANIPPARTSRA